MSQSVRRAAAILESLAGMPQTVMQLASTFGLHRSTMFRELQTLEEVDFVRRRGDGTYVLALHLMSLGQVALESVDLRTAASSHLRELHQVVGNTLHLATIMDDAIIYVDKVEDRGGVRMYSRIGSRAIPHCTAVGKAILSELSTTRRDAILDGVMWRAYTDRSLTSRAALDRELQRVADRGWAADDAEFEELVNCVAVPIRSHIGVLGALSLTAFRAQHPLDEIQHRVPLLRQTAAKIAREIG